jgi:galactokinase/mevalonate kinase-like predicted kinase
VELCGGWLDQPAVNSLVPGAVIVMSIEPDIEFNDKSGMATSSRKKAIEMWQTQIPGGDKIELARLLFCVENPPGTVNVSGSQDQLGIIMPGINKLNYDNGFWPESIESRTDDETLKFVAYHLYLVALPPRRPGYDVKASTNINIESASRLAEATERCWEAITNRDVQSWGRATRDCFEAQLEMFPSMLTDEMTKAIEEYKDKAYGWKVSGCGGGGYLILIADQPLPDAIKVIPRN